jgi:hypothetical protein
VYQYLQLRHRLKNQCLAPQEGGAIVVDVLCCVVLCCVVLCCVVPRGWCHHDRKREEHIVGHHTEYLLITYTSYYALDFHFNTNKHDEATQQHCTTPHVVVEEVIIIAIIMAESNTQKSTTPTKPQNSHHRHHWLE